MCFNVAINTYAGLPVTLMLPWTDVVYASHKVFAVFSKIAKEYCYTIQKDLFIKMRQINLVWKYGKGINTDIIMFRVTFVEFIIKMTD